MNVFCQSFCISAKHCISRVDFYNHMHLKNHMQILIMLELIVGALLIVLVLLQPKEGGLSASLTGVQEVAFERRGAAQALHRITVVV